MVKQKFTFLFLHGAWHNKIVWHKVQHQLEQMGHKTHAITLPGMGDKGYPVEGITNEQLSNIAPITLTTQVQFVVEYLKSIEGKVFCVAWSQAGMILSQLMEVIPEKIQMGIYLSAFMPQDGKSLFDYAKPDEESVVSQKISFLPVGSYPGNQEIPPVACFVPDAHLVEAFYENCSQEDISLLKRTLVVQPLGTFAEPVNLGKSYESVRKAYISCTEDRAITSIAQHEMYTAHFNENFAPHDVYRIETDHTAPFSTPKTLSKVLHRIARKG